MNAKKVVDQLLAEEAPCTQPANPDGTAAPSMKRAHQPFDVYLNGKLIDTVFYSPSANVDEDEVKRSLINHDGYNPGIEVRRPRGKRK